VAPVILDAIVAAKHKAHAARDGAWRDAAIARMADAPEPRNLAQALKKSRRPAIIAELKRRSPSAGAIREGADAAAIARGYAQAGAAAMSVLTDAEFFGGSLADLEAARRAVGIPILRKDFALFEEDLLEARGSGADAVLLIVRLLDERGLHRMLGGAAGLGMDALVEVHSEEECRRAASAGASIVGVNHRDLDSLRIDLGLSERLWPLLPPGAVRVAESGIATAEEVRRMGERGYDAVLVGEALLRAADPGAALAELVAACG
jgi:indole-3-glycerol phosphate synthase